MGNNFLELRILMPKLKLLNLKMWPDFQVLSILQLLAISALLRMRPLL